PKSNRPLVSVAALMKAMRPPTRRWFTTMFLVCSMSCPMAFAEKRITIGIAFDGPSKNNSVMKSIFLEELKALTENEFEFEAPASKQLEGDWTPAKIAAAIDRLEKDKEVAIVLALGFSASQLVATRPALPKPTFAPFVISAYQKLVPRKGNASSLQNLNYL